MKKNILIIVIMLITSGLYITGCNKNENKVEKIVIEQDVTQKVESDYKVQAEKVDLKLDQGDFFEPSFYYEGKVHGYISKGLGKISGTPTTAHPIEGHMKNRIYSVDGNNRLSETTKRVVAPMYNSKFIGYERGNSSKLLSIDYTKEDQVKEEALFQRSIGERKYIANAYHMQYIENNENYVYFISYGSDKNYICVYDNSNKILYDKEVEKGEEFQLIYVESLKSLMAIDNHKGIIYKVKLEQEKIHLEQYINLDIATGDETEQVYGKIINNSEILIIKNKLFNKDYVHNIYRGYATESIMRFNFKTKELKTLFEPPKDSFFNTQYLGNFVFVLEEFEVKEDIMIPKFRYIEVLEEDSIKLLFKESIEDEWKTGYESISTAVVNETGNEIFLKTELTKEEDNIETSVDAIYKRYTIQRNTPKA